MWRALWRSLWAFGSVLLLGCGADVAGITPEPDVSQLYWALTLDQHAVTLSTASPYDTTRITATARTVHGDTLTDLPQVTYRSVDLTRVQVSSDGLLRAIDVGTNIPVIASLTVGHLTHTDTVVVNVTAESAPRRVSTFSIHPPPSDSARWEANRLDFLGLFGSRDLSAQVLDSASNPIPGVVVDYESSDPTIATIDRYMGFLNGKRPGQVRIMASATIYGVRMVDTLQFTITAPLVASVSLLPTSGGASAWGFENPEVTVEVGGVVIWTNQAFQGTEPDLTFATQLDVVFDHPTNVGQDTAVCASLGVVCDSVGGNIAPFGTIDLSQGVFDYLRTRLFPVPGDYPWYSPLLNARGTIHVVQTP